MSHARFNLDAFIHQINTILSSYVSLNQFSYLDNEKKEAMLLKYNNVPTDQSLTPQYAECKDGHYVCIAPSEHETCGRDIQLLTRRIANIYNVRSEIKNINLDKNLAQEGRPKELDITNLTLEEAEEIIIKLQKILVQGQITNNRLSTDFNRVHLSIKQNVDMGMSWLKALWYATWCQSRANTAFEDALKCVEKYKNQKLTVYKIPDSLSFDRPEAPPSFAPTAPLVEDSENSEFNLSRIKKVK